MFRLIRGTELKANFKNINSVRNNLKVQNISGSFSNSSKNQLSCYECPKRYTDQIVRAIKISSNVCIHNIKINKINLEFAQHITGRENSYGPLKRYILMLHAEK
jgi:hypothetical protein